MFGKGYVFEHILFKLKREREEKIYKLYLTDTLKAINDNLTAYIGGGSVLKKRWVEIAETDIKEDTRTGREIADEVIRKAGLIYKERSVGE